MSSPKAATPPPFPNDVAIAPLLKLSLAKLVVRDANEVQRFVHACEDLGFFYLDLEGPGEVLLSEADELFQVGKDLFDLNLEEKQKYNFAHLKTYYGYKHLGANVLDKDGLMDRNEFYNVSKDDLFGIDKKWPAPEVLESQRQLLKSFASSAYAIILLILELLNDHLGLPKGTLQSLHRSGKQGGDHIRFIKAPPQPQNDRRLALGEHTDFGSVTILFNRLGGLQVLPPGDDAEWCYVKPLPNHAIVNLGDAMVKFTNGLLRSNIHRVIAPPGLQGDWARYSLVYFNRPEDDVVLRRLEGSDRIPKLAEGVIEDQVKSKDWIIRRALSLRPDVHGAAAYDLSRARGTETISQRINPVV